MSSGLNIDVGSSSAVVSWDGVSDGAVYTLDLLDTKGETLASIETEDTSVVFQDLNHGTNYVFKLYNQPMVVDFYTNIRITHVRAYWLCIFEVEVYDIDGKKLPSTSFRISSSRIHSRGYAKNAMNGNKAKSNSSWTLGAMLYRTGNSFWQASLRVPTQVSLLRLYSHRTYKLDTESILTMTRQGGQTESYNLGGQHSVVPNDVTFQEISFARVGGHDQDPSPGPDTSVSPLIKRYKSVRLLGLDKTYLTIVEIEVYDGNGIKISRDKFNFESSGRHTRFGLEEDAMNGNKDTRSYRSGTLIRPLSPTYWQATYKDGATEINRVVIYYWSNGRYLSYLKQSKLVLTDSNNNVTSYTLEAAKEQTIQITS